MIIIALGFSLYKIYTYNPEKKLSKGSAGVNVSEISSQNEIVNIDAKSLSSKLLSSGLFGNAGKWSEEDAEKKAEEKVEEPPPSDTLEDTQLNLKLIGTIALSPKDRFAAAFIENSEKRVTAAFGIGQEVIEQVFLEEVYPKEVILLNKKNNPPKKERLRLEDNSLALLKGATDENKEQSGQDKPKTPEEPSSKQIELNRDEIVQDFFASYADLVTRIKPELYRDQEGKIIGVTAKNISEIPIASKLGFKEGDVLTAVNDEPINSEDSITELIRKYTDVTLPAVKVTILRNGNPMDIIYKIQD